MALTRPTLTLTTPARPDTDIAGAAAPAAAATGQAGTVQTVANARFIMRANAVDFVKSVFSVATT